MPEALRGSLEEIRLATLLQLADGEMFTGRLELPGGSIDLRDGAVVAAHQGGLDGLPALRELFLVIAGPFRLVRQPVEAGEPLGSILGLVMEGVRIADEWDRLAPMVLDELDGWPVEPDGAVDRAFLDALDGRRTVYEVVRERTVAPTLVLDRLLALLDEGMLQEVAPARTEEVREWMRRQTAEAAPAEGSGAPDPGDKHETPQSPGASGHAAGTSGLDYASALEAGRRHLRKGEHQEAEQAFRAALEARPADRIAAQNLKRVRALLSGGDARYDWFRTPRRPGPQTPTAKRE